MAPQTPRVVSAAIPLPPHHGRKTIGILTRAARKQPLLAKDGLITFNLAYDTHSLGINIESAFPLWPHLGVGPHRVSSSQSIVDSIPNRNSVSKTFSKSIRGIISSIHCYLFIWVP